MYLAEGGFAGAKLSWRQTVLAPGLTGIVGDAVITNFGQQRRHRGLDAGARRVGCQQQLQLQGGITQQVVIQGSGAALEQMGFMLQLLQIHMVHRPRQALGLLL